MKWHQGSLGLFIPNIPLKPRTLPRQNLKTRFGNLNNLSFPPLRERDISIDLKVERGWVPALMRRAKYVLNWHQLDIV